MRTDRYKIEEPKKKKRGLLKALLFLILFLIIAIAAATAYFYKTAADSISLTFKDDAPSIEFGTDCHVMDFVERNIYKQEMGKAHLYDCYLCYFNISCRSV